MTDIENATEAEALDATTPTEPTPEATLSPEAMSKELARARQEAAKYRTKLREKEEAEKTAAEAKKQAELSAEERAKEAERKAEEAMTAAEARVQAAERKAALAGKVSNPERVLRLMDDPEKYFDGATPDVDAILADFAEYAPAAKSVGASSKASATGTGNGAPQSLADFEGKPHSYYEKHWDAFVARNQTNT